MPSLLGGFARAPAKYLARLPTASQNDSEHDFTIATLLQHVESLTQDLTLARQAAEDARKVTQTAEKNAATALRQVESALAAKQAAELRTVSLQQQPENHQGEGLA